MATKWRYNFKLHLYRHSHLTLNQGVQLE